MRLPSIGITHHISGEQRQGPLSHSGIIHDECTGMSFLKTKRVVSPNWICLQVLLIGCEHVFHWLTTGDGACLLPVLHAMQQCKCSSTRHSDELEREVTYVDVRDCFCQAQGTCSAVVPLSRETQTAAVGQCQARWLNPSL